MLENSNRVCQATCIRKLRSRRLQAGQPNVAASLRAESLQQPPLQPFPDPWLAALRAFDVSGSVDSTTADQLRGQGRLSEAATRLAARARRFPDRSRPALNLALARRDQGQLEQALDDLQKLAERFPTDPLVHFHLAVTLAQLGRQDAATSSLHTCLQIKPDYGLARSAARRSAGCRRPIVGGIE
jgi:tetratricopeptide (TPR) repeat protein